MEDSLRPSGIDVIGSVPWGTHFCQFYQTREDLLDLLIPYFKAGLENNEFCMWVTAEPLDAGLAHRAMAGAITDFDTYVERGQIEIMPHDRWYLRGGHFDAHQVLNGWVSKLEQALARGYAGLRLTGNTFWLEKNIWRAFEDYEARVNEVIGRYRMLALCTYSLDKCDGAAVIDVVRNHQFALIKQKGKWDLIESSLYRQTQEALKRSEEQYRNLFDTMTEGFALHEIILDGSGKPCDYRFLQTNAAFEKLTGLSRVSERTVREVLPDLEYYWIETYGKVALSGESVHFENFSAPLGKWYEVYAYAPEKGYFVTLFRDVTQRKRAEEALRESQRDLNRAQAVAHTGSWRLDVRCNELVWSDETHRIFGIPRGKPMTYETFLSAVHPEDRQHVDESWQAALRGEPYDIEHRILVDGNVKWVRERAELELDEQGTLLGGFGTVQDITERKSAEEELRRSRALLVEAERMSHTGAWEWDLITNQWTFSDEWLSIHGCRKRTLSPDELLPIAHPDDRAAILRAFEDVRNGVKPYSTEHRIIRQDTGEVRNVRAFGRIVKDASGTSVKVLGVAQDITAQKRADEQLRELNETLEQRVAERTAEVEHLANQLRALAAELTQVEQRERKRLANILHDHIQQLLVAARLQLEWIKRHPGGKRSQSTVQAVDSILKEAIDASRSLAIELSPPVLHEAGLIAGLNWLATKMAEKNQFKVDIRSDSRAEPATEDIRLLLFECVRELLFNALKHSGVRQAGVIVMRTRDGRIKIVVEDKGKGFDPDVQRTRCRGAATLGLFSIQQSLAHIGGSLQIETAPGEGTRVTLTVPAPDEKPSAGAGERAAPATEEQGALPVERKGARIRVLIVDDHRIVREGLAGLLQFESDIDVVGLAADGPQAIEMTETLTPDVIIMDINLEGMSGVEATQIIKSRRPDIKVIGLSMHLDKTISAAMQEAGATAYLTKGGPSGDLIEAIRACRGV